MPSGTSENNWRRMLADTSAKTSARMRIYALSQMNRPSLSLPRTRVAGEDMSTQPIIAPCTKQTSR
jgi:hypothetical protein